MTLRWDPDDPRWLSVEPDLQTVDLQVLRQVGVPEPILLLAVRRARSTAAGVPGSHTLGRVDLSFLDTPPGDVEGEPYWEDETSCRDYRRW